MTVTAATLPARKRQQDAVPSGGPLLRGLGCAVPSVSRQQDEAVRELAEVWELRGTALDRWRRINAGTGIETRHGVLPPHEVVPLTTSQRMEAYEQYAPPLAAQAAARALETAGVATASITDLIVVSCTGFAAPGIDSTLIKQLSLGATTRRCTIGFMGCFGAISGLRAAAATCCASPRAATLVVCCELCSLHVPPKPTIHDMIATALFADGAAAAVVTGRDFLADPAKGTTTGGERSLGSLTLGHSRILPEGADWMRWRIRDSGFAMTLDKAVPGALRQALPSFVREALPGPLQSRTFVVHPGGPGILDAVDDALELSGGYGLEASWDVLRRYGNLSSATLLFVLDALCELGAPLPATMLAFGPGLTIESLVLMPE